jgi:hypothetical protein
MPIKENLKTFFGYPPGEQPKIPDEPIVEKGPPLTVEELWYGLSDEPDRPKKRAAPMPQDPIAALDLASTVTPTTTTTTTTTATTQFTPMMPPASFTPMMMPPTSFTMYPPLDSTSEARARLERHNEYALWMQAQNPTFFAQHPFVPMPPQNPFAMPSQNPFAMPPSPFQYEALPEINGQKQPNVRRIISGAELERAVPAPQGNIEYVPTVDSKECRRLIKEREIKRNRPFSAAQILADRHALSIINATQNRLLEQYWFEIAREKELLSYIPDWNYCDSLRWKSANSDKSNKHNLDAPKPVKAAQKSWDESESDEEFELKTSEPPAEMFSTPPMQFAEEREVYEQFKLFMAKQAAKASKGTGLKLKKKKKASRNSKHAADEELDG